MIGTQKITQMYKSDEADKKWNSGRRGRVSGYDFPSSRLHKHVYTKCLRGSFPIEYPIKYNTMYASVEVPSELLGSAFEVHIMKWYCYMWERCALAPFSYLHHTQCYRPKYIGIWHNLRRGHKRWSKKRDRNRENALAELFSTCMLLVSGK